jgi:hypothetical protein
MGSMHDPRFERQTDLYRVQLDLARSPAGWLLTVRVLGDLVIHSPEPETVSHALVRGALEAADMIEMSELCDGRPQGHAARSRIV